MLAKPGKQLLFVYKQNFAWVGIRILEPFNLKICKVFGDNKTLGLEIKKYQ
jgi:hypothetical protein